MDKFQPTFTQPIKSEPHISRLRQELPMAQAGALQETPVPEPPPYIQSGPQPSTAMLGRQLTQRRLQAFRPARQGSGDEAHTFPILRLAATPRRPTETIDQSSRAGIPRTPPCSIPGYFTSKPTLREPGLGEALLGCGMLLLVGMLVLALLYYLSL